jgi:hypothetical protein
MITLWAIGKKLIRYNLQNIFFPPRAIYFIVYDPMTDGNQVLTWIQIIKRSFITISSPALVVVSMGGSGEEERIHKQNMNRFHTLNPNITDLILHGIPKSKAIEIITEKFQSLVSSQKECNKTVPIGVGVLKRHIAIARKSKMYINEKEWRQV